MRRARAPARVRPPGDRALETVLASFALVALAEMGDKTQLLAFALATRFRRPWVVLSGMLAATIVNHAIAAAIGAEASVLVPRRVLEAALAVTFVGFGVWALQADTLDPVERPSRYGPFLTSAVLFFLAEMGDKTQLATVALGARFRSVALVTAGTTLGMLAADGLAVFVGDRLARAVPVRLVRLGAACLFFAFGIVSGVAALRGA